MEVVAAYQPDEFGVQLPPEASLSAAFSLAARRLVDQPPAFEFLPPKLTILEQFAAKYSSGRLRTVGAVAAGIVLIVGGMFFVQQIELWRLRSQWKGISAKVSELHGVQGHIQQFQPWFNDSFPELAILRQLTLAFPQTGLVTAKTITIQGGNTVSCSGNTQDTSSLLAMQANLRQAAGVSGVKLNLIHGNNPMQFTFDFQYNGNGGAQ